MKRRFNLEVKNISCEKYGQILKHFDCGFQKIAENSYTVNIKFNFQRELDLNAEVKVLTYFTPTNNLLSKTVKLFDLKLKICDVISNKMGVPLLKQIVNDLRKSGDYPYSCPIKTVRICWKLLKF